MNNIFILHGLIVDKWNQLLLCDKDDKNHEGFISYLKNSCLYLKDLNNIELCLDIVDFIVDCSFDCKLITLISSDEIMFHVAIRCVNKTLKNKIS